MTQHVLLQRQAKSATYRDLSLFQRSHSVVCRLQLVVTQPHKHVAEVYSDSTRYGIHLGPFTLRYATCPSPIQTIAILARRVIHSMPLSILAWQDL